MFGESNYNKAVDLYNSSKFQEAIPKFIKAIESGDLNEANIYNSFVFLGTCCNEVKDYDSAIVYLKKALEWDADFFSAYYELGRVYYNKEEYEVALYNFDKAIAGRDGYLDSWYYKGITLERLGNYKEAIPALKNALKIAVSENSDLSDLFTLHCKLGECYSNINQNQAAILEYNAALQIDSQSPDAVDAFIGLSDLYAARLQFDETIGFINKSIRILETNISDTSLSKEEKLQIHERIGELQFTSRWLSLLKDRKYNELLNLFRNKYNYNNQNGTDAQVLIMSFVITVIGVCLHKLRRYDELLTTITPHLSDGGDNGVYASYVGIAHYQKKHYETALQYLDRGIENGNDDESDTWGYKGECHFILGQYDKAIESYQKSIEVRIPNDDDDFEIAYLEEKIQAARQKLAQEKSKVIPSHITIQGNSAPINFGGILATDDAIINRSTVADDSGVASHSAFCPECGSSVEVGDKFCRRCGRKL